MKKTINNKTNNTTNLSKEQLLQNLVKNGQNKTATICVMHCNPSI